MSTYTQYNHIVHRNGKNKHFEQVPPASCFTHVLGHKNCVHKNASPANGRHGVVRANDFDAGLQFTTLDTALCQLGDHHLNSVTFLHTLILQKRTQYTNWNKSHLCPRPRNAHGHTYERSRGTECTEKNLTSLLHS